MASVSVPRCSSRRAFLAGLATSSLPLLTGAAAASEGGPDAAARAAAWTGAVLVGTDGRAITLGEVAAPVVLVHVWASWCPACLGELTSIQALAERLGPDGLATLLVSHPKNWERDTAFARRAGLRLPAYTLDPGAPWAVREAVFDVQGGSYSVPRTLVFAGRERRCVLVKAGPEDWQSPRAVARLRPWLGTA